MLCTPGPVARIEQVLYYQAVRRASYPAGVVCLRDYPAVSY